MNCPTCGEVEHLAIAEDSAHCECSVDRVEYSGWIYLTSSVVPCDCECHR